MTVKYTEDHEWISFDEAGPATVGITQHAQDALVDDIPPAAASAVDNERRQHDPPPALGKNTKPTTNDTAKAIAI